MIDKELAHEIVNKLRGKEIRHSDVLESILLYEYRLGLEHKIEKAIEKAEKFANAITDRHSNYEGDASVCIHCNKWSYGDEHEEDCVVNEAEKFKEMIK